MKASKIGLLILILGFGGTVETAWRVRNHVGGFPRFWFDKYGGPSFRYENAPEVRTVAAGTALVIENRHGLVSIKQAPGSEMRITLAKVVYLPTDEKAREFAARVNLVATDQAGRLHVTTNRHDVENSARDVGFETHLSITVPPGTPVKVDSEHGRIEVSDVASAELSGSHEEIRVERVAGPVTIKGRHDDVTVSTVTGALRAEVRHGRVEVKDIDGAATLDVDHGSISAERVGGLVISNSHGDVDVAEVKGDLQVVARHSGISASRVAGRATVETSHNDVNLDEVGADVSVKVDHGGVRVEDVTGNAKVRTTYNDVTLTRVGGTTDVEVKHGGVRAEGLAQDAVLRTTGGNVEVDGFRGRMDVVTERAGVNLVATAPLTAPITVRTSNGDVELDVPAGSPFGIEASARHGDVSANVSQLAFITNEQSRIVGQLGTGGPAVKLDATHGNVRVREKTALAAQQNP
jgi:DUF4097 and DUF4098 domain-containing protein YvlB